MDCEANARILLESMLLDASVEPTDLPLSLLKAITNNFSDDQRIGSGGFAVVYKGLLQNGTVAVKKLAQAVDIDEKNFNREVSSMIRVKHKNIVRFLGYCADTQGKIDRYQGKVVMLDVRERLLCFEYMPNGGLHGYITDASRGLVWRTRYQIIKGICEGLHYLHEKNIVHLDLKPANILLDYNMAPKIADFGLSRCFDEKQSRAITSKLVGSLGYLAPEFFRGVITLKLDIYSLGVILIEILTGQKGYPAINIDNVLQTWTNRLEKSQGDTDLEHVRVCTEIALECLDYNPEKRPTTQRIMEILNEIESRCVSVETDDGTSSATKVSSESLGTINDLGELRLASEFIWVATSDLGSVECIDVHPTEPWILVAHREGCVCIWDYQKQEKMMEKRVATWSKDTPKRLIFSAKFIAREQCFATGVGDIIGLVRVYSYTTKARVMEFEAHGGEPVSSLAVHSTEPFLLTASYQDKWIKVWDWAQGWLCTRVFDAHDQGVRSFTFDPRNANTYASASRDDVKVWNINSSDPITKLEMPCSHYCDFFIDIHRHFLVTFSSINQCAYIWDLETRKRVRELSKIRGIACHPMLPILATTSISNSEGMKNSHVCLWDTRTYSLVRRVFLEDSPIRGLTFTSTKELTRLVVPCQRGISIVEIKLPKH
ncbi:unnamed protein product [Urochloa humidicola]